jgi:hypothetical protein
MGISLKTHKLLWGRSGGKCAICKTRLLVGCDNEMEDPSVIGDEAHIIARSKSFTRGDYENLSAEERDSYGNLILLCKNHHKEIDDKPNEYPVEKLRKIKAEHESEVEASFSDADQKKFDLDLMYAGIVDKWVELAGINEWKTVGGCLNDYASSFPRKWTENLDLCCEWLFSRIWDERFESLNLAFTNFRCVARDLLNTFNLHVNPDSLDDQILITERFYKIDEYNEKLYHKLLKQYEDHENLVNDLFFELTRAANYVCDHVRNLLDPSFMRTEGALYILRANVGFGFETYHIRPEYQKDERTAMPYPGIDKFVKIRYTRDHAIDPDPSPPPFKRFSL